MPRKVAYILGLDCQVDSEEPLAAGAVSELASPRHVPAPIFALELPDRAVAGEPFSINAWVGLADPLHDHDEVLPDTFTARFDPRSQSIVVTGSLRRGQAQAPRPRIARALIVGIHVTAPAGMWRLCIPDSHYAPDGSLAGDETPPARATQWIQVQAK